MMKQNKTEKKLWPYIIISFAIVFVMAVVVQHWTNSEPETVYSNDTIENIVENYQEVDDVAIVEEIEAVENDATEIVKSFGDAFSKARTEKGIGQSFVWEDKKFTTFLAGEEKQKVKELIPILDESELTLIGIDIDAELVENSTIEVTELVESVEIKQDNE